MSEKILLIGFACVDICLLCKEYPKVEDTCNKVRNVIKRRGGNSSNSSTVLRQLQVPCHLFTSFGKGDDAEWLIKDLSDLGVILTNCPRVDVQSPITYLILSDETGSRTTFSWKEKSWSEPKYEDFLKLDLSEYSWVHFEGRNDSETKKMIARVREWNNSKEGSKKLRISIEIEQQRQSITDFIPLGDVVIISKDFALYDGLKSMEEVIQKYKNAVRPEASIVVPWGELGASVYLPDGTIFFQGPFPPKKVIDTVAAGDTFIAALTMALSRQQSLQEATTFACRVAGAKVGIMGMDGLLEAIS